MMKNLILLIAFVLTTANAQTPLTNTFTYQGELKMNNALADGTFDFEFNVFDVATNGSVLETVVVEDVTVTNGVFTTPITLTMDLFTGNMIWLDIGVRDGASTGAFDALSPRQEVTSSPYAIHAQFVDLSTIPSWNVGGNATNTGDFIGTTNSKTFIIKVNNVNGLTVIPAKDSANTIIPNIVLGTLNTIGPIFGSSISGGRGNTITSTYATISGGSSNSVSGDRSVISGGTLNQASGSDAVVGGGQNNKAMALQSTVSGGNTNIAEGLYSTVPGGAGNIAGGDYSFAAGLGAIVRDATTTGITGGDIGTFVWADSSSFSNFTSTGSNQFRARATGGAYFEVSGAGLSPPGFHVEQKGASGVGMLIRQTSSDANLVLVNKGTGDIIKAFTGAGGGNLVFRVAGNGNVTADGSFSGGGADFAEYLPTVETNLQVAEVVGLNNGKVSRNTGKAQTVMVISTNPAFVGNNDKHDNADKALVAFTGQVPVKVRTAVQAGDWLMASGDNDGYAKVVQLDTAKALDYTQIIGQALESSDGDKVLSLVGLPAHALMAKQQQLISEQQLKLEIQQQQIAKLQNQQQQILTQLQDNQALKQQLAEIKLMLKRNQYTELLAQNKEVQGE